MSKDSEEDYLYYTEPARIARILRKGWARLTADSRRVNVEVMVTEAPPPERQHITGHKWKWYVTFMFDRQMTSIHWSRLGKLNSLLLATEEDKLLVGVYFVTVSTDHPEKYDSPELALAICDVFDFSLQQCRILQSGARAGSF